MKIKPTLKYSIRSLQDTLAPFISLTMRLSGSNNSGMRIFNCSLNSRSISENFYIIIVPLSQHLLLQKRIFLSKFKRFIFPGTCRWRPWVAIVALSKTFKSFVGPNRSMLVQCISDNLSSTHEHKHIKYLMH